MEFWLARGVDGCARAGTRLASRPAAVVPVRCPLPAPLSRGRRRGVGRTLPRFRVDSAPTLLEDRRLRDEPLNPGYQPGVDNPHDRQLHYNYTQDVAPVHHVIR